MPEEKCLDCFVWPGKVHKWGCDWEVCPFCGGQLISCGCADKKLNLKGKAMTPGQNERWWEICEATGRIPFLNKNQVKVISSEKFRQSAGMLSHGKSRQKTASHKIHTSR